VARRPFSSALDYNHCALRPPSDFLSFLRLQVLVASLRFVCHLTSAPNVSVFLSPFPNDVLFHTLILAHTFHTLAYDLALYPLHFSISFSSLVCDFFFSCPSSSVSPVCFKPRFFCHYLFPPLTLRPLTLFFFPVFLLNIPNFSSVMRVILFHGTRVFLYFFHHCIPPLYFLPPRFFRRGVPLGTAHTQLDCSFSFTRTFFITQLFLVLVFRSPYCGPRFPPPPSRFFPFFRLPSSQRSFSFPFPYLKFRPFHNSVLPCDLKRFSTSHV